MRRLVLLIGAVALSVPCAMPVIAAEVSASSARKWATDAVLREGLTEIRSLVLRHHTLITHRRISPDDARRFAADIQREADRTVTGLLLSGEPRDEARRLLAAIDAGAAQVARNAGSIEAVDGLMRIDEALEAYGQRFDHPDWRPLR